MEKVFKVFGKFWKKVEKNFGRTEIQINFGKVIWKCFGGKIWYFDEKKDFRKVLKIKMLILMENQRIIRKKLV